MISVQDTQKPLFKHRNIKDSPRMTLYFASEIFYRNIKDSARMTLYFASEFFFLNKQVTLKQSSIFPVTLDNLEQSNSA